MISISTIFGVILAVLIGAIVLAAVIFLFTKLFGLTMLVLRNIFRFIGEEVTDTLRLVGAVLASILFAPLVVLSIIIGRWSASKHYAGALMNELRAGTRCVYRLAIGNLARLFGVSKALEGVEQRVPDMMAAAPTRDKPSKRVGIFEGYTIVGSLKGGGSGGKLYIAEPDEIKRAVFAKRKLGEVEQVVIKVFSLRDGSSLPQIVRESRALDAARSLGLVLEHQMTPDRFFYVMRYVPGESLSMVTQRLHALSASEGLDNDHLGSVMSFSEDLLVALDTYHNAELWHKDVKPDNIIIDGHDKDAKAHLVDFGLVTPMRSSMTLTTHGTEYFRDPELVRQALRGVKVHQIDGSKFDIYGAGAVLFSMIENSFPAHGGLSQLTKRCPEALRWIVRRSMAEYDRRYPSAAAMLADLRVVIEAEDPFKVKPIDLPSVSQGDVAAAQKVESQPSPMYGQAFDEPVHIGGGSPVPPNRPRVAPPVRGGRVGRPQTVLTSWWSGKYAIGRQGAGRAAGSGGVGNGPFVKASHNVQTQVRHAQRSLRDANDRRPAAQQVKDARKRAHEMRTRAGKRIHSTRRSNRSYGNTPGVAVVFAGLLGLGVLFAGSVLAVAMFTPVFYDQSPVVVVDPPNPPIIVAEASVRHDGWVDDHDDESIKVSLGGLHSVDAKVLMVPMLPQPIEPQLLAELQGGLEVLRSKGLEIRGDLNIDGDDEFVIEQTAELRNAIGSVPVDSIEFPMKIQQWLGSKSYDGVLMFVSDPSEPEFRNAMLVMDEFHTLIPLSERTVNDLLAVLSKNGYAKD
jgi:serine/threonine protein kinase